LSKAYGLAGVRVGIAFSSPVIIQYFNKMKPPYNISTINQKAALTKLSRMQQFQKQISNIKKEKVRLSEILPKIRIIKKVYPSDANFLLVKVKDANTIYNALINRNIITRNRSSLIENCLRITIGKKSENDKLINALHELDNLM